MTAENEAAPEPASGAAAEQESVETSSASSASSTLPAADQALSASPQTQTLAPASSALSQLERLNRMIQSSEDNGTAPPPPQPRSNGEAVPIQPPAQTTTGQAHRSSGSGLALLNSAIAELEASVSATPRPVAQLLWRCGAG